MAASVGISSHTPVRLLPTPMPRTPAHTHADDGGGLGLTFSLPERGAADAGPVIAHVFPASAADVDGTVQVGDRLLSVDSEPVRSWSMAKLRRVVASKEQVSLEVDRGGLKFVTTLTRGSGSSALRAGRDAHSSPNATTSRLSLSALAERDTAMSLHSSSRSTAQVEQLQARCEELSAGKAALEMKILDLLSKDKIQATKGAAVEKECQRSKTLAANLTAELQSLQEKCVSLEKANSELTSTLKAAQGAKAQILERAQRDENVLKETEQNLMGLQRQVQESKRALDDERRAHLLLRTEMTHAQDLLRLERKRREECEAHQQRSDDQLEAHSLQAQKLEEEIHNLQQRLRDRDLESLDHSQRADRSSAHAHELENAIKQLQYELDTAREEKAKLLDERLELRRAVNDLEHAMQTSVDFRDAKNRASRNPWTDERNPQDRTSTLTLAQRILKTTAQIKNIRHDYAEVMSTNQELDSKFMGLVKTNDVFRHRIQDVESLVLSLVSELRDISSEAEFILEETDRLQTSSVSQSSSNSAKIVALEQRMMQRETELQEASEKINILTRAREDSHASLERCERLRSSAEDMARKVEGKAKTLQSDLEKAENGNRRAAAESDFLRRTIQELEAQYKDLQTQTSLSIENGVEELRSARKEGLRLQAELSEVTKLHMASVSDAKEKEGARLQAATERDELERHLKEVKMEVTNLDVELRSAEKERDDLLVKLEQQAARAQHLDKQNATLVENVNQTNLGLGKSERMTADLQHELNELQAIHERLFADHTEANKHVVDLKADLIEMRRLLASNEAEIDNLQTINESLYSEKNNALEEAALLSQQYRDTKQQEARLIAELAESRLESHSMSVQLSEQKEISDRLQGELSHSRQQHASAALHASEVQSQVAHAHEEFGQVQNLLVRTEEELHLIRKRLAEAEEQKDEMVLQKRAADDMLTKLQKEAAEYLKRIDELEITNVGLKDDNKQSENVVASLTESNNGLAQRNLNLESELDEQLSKLHDAQAQYACAMESTFEKGSEIVSLEEKFKALDFEKSCLQAELENCNQRLQEESTARKAIEGAGEAQAQEIVMLKETVARVGVEGRQHSSSLDEMWKNRCSALEEKLTEALQGKNTAEQLARDHGEQVAALEVSNRELESRFETIQKDLKEAQIQERELKDSYEKAQELAVISQKELEGSLRSTKEAFESERSKLHHTDSELQKVTRQRERLREEFISLSGKYKAMMNESDKLANSFDAQSRSRLTQTAMAGDVLNQNMENVRNEFEDDMLRMALDLKDLVHHQFNFESPGSDNMQFTPERRSLYRSVASAGVTNPREEIRAIATLGIARDRIHDLEERVVEKENELAQSTNALAQIHGKQAEAEAALLASKQRQESLEQEIQVLTESQRQMHSETIRYRSECEQAKELADSRNQDLEIQRQAVSDVMTELKVEQGKVLSAAQRDETLSKEMEGLRTDYNDAIEAYKVAEMRWAKKVLEAETNMAESAEAAKVHLNSCRAIEAAKKDMEASLLAKLNDANKAYEESVQKYEMSKAAWDEEMEEIDRKCKESTHHNQQLRAQVQESDLAHRGLVVQIEESEAELSMVKVENEKLSKNVASLDEQMAFADKTLKDLRDGAENSAKQILELEDALAKVQDDCKRKAATIVDIEGEVTRLQQSLASGELNLEKMTSAYQDLTNRFNLCLKREMDAVTKIDQLEASIESFVAESEKRQGLVQILENEKIEMQALNAQLQENLQEQKSENDKLRDQSALALSRIHSLEGENDALQGSTFISSSQIESLEGRISALQKTLQQHEAEKLESQKQSSENDKKLRWYAEMEQRYTNLTRDHGILNTTINVLQQQYQSAQSSLADTEAQLRDAVLSLDRSEHERLALQQQQQILDEQVEKARGEADSKEKKLLEEKDNLALLTADNKAMQKYVTLLEEQVQTQNGFIALHEKDKQDLKLDIAELKNSQEDDRTVMSSLRLELSQLEADLSSCEGRERASTIQCEMYERNVLEIEQRLELAANTMEVNTQLMGLLQTAMAHYAMQSFAISNGMEMALDMLQPIIDEVTYRTADISILRDGHSAWRNAEARLAKELAESKRLREENEEITRSMHALQSDGISKERVLVALRDQLDGLHNTCLKHASENGQLKESVNLLDHARAGLKLEIANMQERLASACEALQSEQEQRSNMQVEREERARETIAADRCIKEIEIIADVFAKVILDSNQAANAMMCMLSSSQLELASLREDRFQLQQALTLSQERTTSLEIQSAALENSVSEEQNGRARTSKALADATERVNELQAAVQDLHKETIGKQRLISYLEEQQSSLAGSLTLHEANLKEKDALMESMDVSWLQDKNQLMRKENEVDTLSTHLAHAQDVICHHEKHDTKITQMIGMLESNVERLSCLVHDTAYHGNDVISLRSDRQSLFATQELLEHERSKVTVLNEVLKSLQEGYERLQDSQKQTLEELDVVSKRAETLQETLDKLESENLLMSRKIAFFEEQSNFYSSEIEGKVKALNAGLSTVTDIISQACRECFAVPELRSSRKLAQEMEDLLRATEHSLASERVWSQDKGAELKRLEACILKMEDKFAEKSLIAEKLERELSECSLRVLAVQKDRDQLEDLMHSSSQDTITAERCIKEAESLPSAIASTLSEVYSGISLLKRAHDERLKDLVDKNSKLTNNLAEATSTNFEHQQAEAELQVKIERLSADLDKKESLISVLQGQIEAMQTKAVANATEKSQLHESLSSMHQLQGRLAQTETELDRFQKLHVTLQAENAQLRRDSLQVESSLRAIDDVVLLLSVHLEKSMEVGNSALERLRQGLLPASDVAVGTCPNSSLQGQVHRVIELLHVSWQENKQLNDDLLAAQCSLAGEQEVLTRKSEALAQERIKVAEIQNQLHDLQADMSGKHRYIQYLEEQQTSLHSSMLARELDNAEQAKAKKEEENRVMMRRITIRISKLCTEKCLNVWQERTKDEVRKRALLKRASGKILLVSVANTLATWWEVVRECKEQRSKEADQRQHEMQSAMLLEAKHELLSAGDLRKELLGKEQLIKMMEKQIEAFQIQVLHHEEGKAEAAVLRQELHIASVEVTEQKRFLEEYQHQKAGLQEALANKEGLVAELEAQVQSMQVTWQRLEQEKDTLEARLASVDSSLLSAKQRDQLQCVTLESMTFCLNEVLPQVTSLESTLAYALADARRVRHELLKSMAENVELQERLESAEAERQMVNLSLESAAALSRESNMASAVSQAKIEELQYINIERQQMIFDLSKDLAVAQRYQDTAEDVGRDIELQSIIIDTLEEQLESICFLMKDVPASSGRLQVELSDSKATVSELRLNLTSCISEREMLKKTISEVQTDSQSNQKLVPLLESQVESLHGSLVQREAENQRLASQISDLQTQNTSQFVEMSILKTKLNDCAAPVALAAEYKADAENSARILQHASEKIEKLENVIMQSDTAVLSLRHELLEKQEKLMQSMALLGEWKGKIHGFESETVSASTIIAHLHEQIRALQQQTALQSSEKDALEARLLVMQDIRIEGQAQLETIKQGLSIDREEIASLRGRNVLLEQQISEMREVDASKERLLSLMEQAAHSNQGQIQVLTDELESIKSAHRQAEGICDAVDKVCQVMDKMSQSLSDASTDKVFLQGMVARLEAEYEEEQQLSAMLQTQVQTLHAVVLQHEELKKS